MTQIREQVWQSLVTQYLVEEQIRKLGITVSDQELIDWFRGENPPEELKRNFIDSTGQFRRDVYDQFLANPNQFVRDPQGSDPEFGTKWLAGYEHNLRMRRTQEKLQSLILASVRVDNGELRQRFDEQNTKYDARYALFDANALVKDADITVSDADLKNYYEEHIDQYKREASRKLDYVMFLEKASAADSAGRIAEINDAAQKARAGVDFLDLVYTYSDKPDSGAYFRHGELSPAVESAVFGASVGDVVGPITDGDGVRLFKILGEKKGVQEFVRAQHILISLDPQADTTAAKALAQRLAQQARSGADFAKLAREHSSDAGTAQRGGELGWFGKGRMVPEFEKAAFAAKPGQIVGPVRTLYGMHIIKVEARDSRELKLANITMKIGPSSQTRSDIFERARDFAYNARENEFAAEAKQLDFTVQQTEVVGEGGVIPGIGVNPSASRWAFGNSVGTVSEPFSIPSGYAVFHIAEVRDAGVRPFEEVKESIRPLALREKKIQKVAALASGVRAQLQAGDSLAKVSQLRPDVQVLDTGPFTLAGNVPGIGRDQKFLGAVAALKPGEISPPVEGLRGAYLIQLVSLSQFDSAAFASQHEMLSSRMLQEKRNRFLTDWLAKLKEKADIEDRRDLFFR
jgi:peptidyl-prolyl cis-trans isomerase D